MKNKTNLQDVLKTLAIFAMILDHLAEYCLRYYLSQEQTLFLRGLGRFAMPIFCFFAGYNSKNSLAIYNLGIILELSRILNKYFYHYILKNNIINSVMKMYLIYSIVTILIVVFCTILSNQLKKISTSLKTDIMLAITLILISYFSSQITHTPANILIPIYIGKIFVNFLIKNFNQKFMIFFIYFVLSISISYSYHIFDYGNLSILFVLSGGLVKINSTLSMLCSTYCILFLLKINQAFFFNKGIVYTILNICIHIASWASLNMFNHKKTVPEKLKFIRYISRNALPIYTIHAVILYLINLAIKLHLIYGLGLLTKIISIGSDFSAKSFAKELIKYFL